MKKISHFSTTVHIEVSLPFPYKNREGFFKGEAYDLLFENNAIIVNCSSFDDNMAYKKRHGIRIVKNDESNVNVKLHYMSSKYFFFILL
jgi:hypothetical protein